MYWGLKLNWLAKAMKGAQLPRDNMVSAGFYLNLLRTKSRRKASVLSITSLDDLKAPCSDELLAGASRKPTAGSLRERKQD